MCLGAFTQRGVISVWLERKGLGETSWQGMDPVRCPEGHAWAGEDVTALWCCARSAAETGRRAGLSSRPSCPLSFLPFLLGNILPASVGGTQV